MKTDIWMPIYIGDYLKSTSRLTMRQHGAYLLLMMEYWDRGMLVATPEQCFMITRAFTIEEQEDVRFVLSEFFEENESRYIQKRMEKELTTAKERKGKAVEKAKKAAQARWGKEDASSIPSSNAQAKLKECPSPSPSPSPSQTSKPKKKDIYSDFPELNLEAWQRWLEYKKEIKSKYKTENGEKNKIANLIKISGGDKDLQAKLIKQAMDEEWKGIHPLITKSGVNKGGGIDILSRVSKPGA